jgi:putative transposase
VEAELQEFLAEYRDRRDEQGRQVVVRNGYLPERTITTGVGEVAIQVPKVRDRSGSGDQVQLYAVAAVLETGQ